VLQDIVIKRRPIVRRADPEELERHARRLDSLDKSAGGQSIWRKLDTSDTIH
jgi:DNA polymerase-3 subunit epsilon